MRESSCHLLGANEIKRVAKTKKKGTVLFLEREGESRTLVVLFIKGSDFYVIQIFYVDRSFASMIYYQLVCIQQQHVGHMLRSLIHYNFNP